MADISADMVAFVMTWCRTTTELSEFLAFVIIYGPDAFPAERQMTMEKAFRFIREGFSACSAEIEDRKMDQFQAQVDQAEALLSSGEEARAFICLQELKSALVRT